MTEELRNTLKYYDEIFFEDSLDKRVEDYCNKKHLYRLYSNKPVVLKEIKTSLKEFANQETEHLSKQLTKAKAIIRDYKIVVEGDHITVCGVPEENRCINVLKLNEQAEQFLKDIKEG